MKGFVAACSVCCHGKFSHRPPAGLLQPHAVPRCPWSHIAVGFVVGLPPSEVNSYFNRNGPVFQAGSFYPSPQTSTCYGNCKPPGGSNLPSPWSPSGHLSLIGCNWDVTIHGGLRVPGPFVPIPRAECHRALCQRASPPLPPGLEACQSHPVPQLADKHRIPDY